MRKLTPEERAAKKALTHVHDENCGHEGADASAVEQPTEEADKPKRGRRKADEEQVVAEAPAVVEEPVVAEAPAEVAEAPAE